MWQHTSLAVRYSSFYREWSFQYLAVGAADAWLSSVISLSTDSEGDIITIGSDKELATAVKEQQSELFRLYVTVIDED